MNKVFFALLAFTPLALLAAYFHFSPILTFFLSAIAIIPLAKYIGDFSTGYFDFGRRLEKRASKI